MWKKLAAPEMGADASPSVVWGLAVLLLLLHFSVSWAAHEIGLHVVRDDARYILLARSLSSFEYRNLFLVDSPIHTLYPPIYPLLLLGWGTLFGESFVGFTLLGVIFSTAALGLLFAALKRVTSPGVALACLAALAVNSSLVARAGSVRSEVAYMFFSLLALWALADWRGVSTGEPAKDLAPHGALARRDVRAAAAGLAMGAAIVGTLTRINGIALLVAIGLLWLGTRRFRALGVFIAAALVTTGAWFAWSALTAPSLPESSYFQDIARTLPQEGLAETVWRRTGTRAWRLFAESVPWQLPLPTVQGTVVDNLVLTGGATLSLIAGCAVLIRRWPAAGLYLLVYLLTLFPWPYLRGRFIEVILPLLVPAVLIGAGALAGALRASWRKPTLVAVSLLLTVTGLVKTTDLVRTRSSCEPFQLADPPACLSDEQRSLLMALHDVSENAPPDAVFLSTMPEPLYYYTARQSISWPVARRVREEDFVRFLKEQEVEWILLTSNSRGISARLLPHCDELVLEGIFPPRTYLLRLPRPGEVATPETSCAAIAEHRERSTDA